MGNKAVTLMRFRKKPNFTIIYAIFLLISNPLIITNFNTNNEINRPETLESSYIIQLTSKLPSAPSDTNTASTNFDDSQVQIIASSTISNFTYPENSTIIPLAHAQTEEQLREAYKALFNRIYTSNDVELVMNSFNYNSMNYPMGTLASMNQLGGNFNFTRTNTSLNISAGLALHPKKIAIFKSELQDGYGQNITWEEGYFQRLFRVYLWGDYFDPINETGIKNNDLKDYDILILPAVIKDNEKAVVKRLGGTGKTNLRKFVQDGNLLYAQGGSCYIAEAANLIPDNTVLLKTRISANNSHANMTVVNSSSIMSQNWLSDRMYLLDDPALNTTNASAVVAKYTGNLTSPSLLNSPAIMVFDYYHGRIVLTNGHPSVNNEFYPIVLNALLMGMAEPTDLRATARQIYNEDVDEDLIPAQEPNVTVVVEVQYLNFWPVTSPGTVNLTETISLAFFLDTTNITPKPSQIRNTSTKETELTWLFNDAQGNQTFVFYVRTYPNTTKKGVADICTGVVSHNPRIIRDGGEIYHDKVTIRAALAAHLNGDRDIELDGCYPLPASGFYYDIALPLENKEETTAKNITITDIVVLKSPIVDVNNQTRVPEAWNNTNNGTNDTVFAINEIFYYYDEQNKPLYPLPNEVSDTNYTYEFTNGSNITLPAKKLVWHYPDIIAYDYQEPAIRYGIFTHEEFNRTVSFMSDPIKGSVILNASGGSVYTNLGIHPVPYHEYLQHGIVYIPKGNETPRVDYDDVWNRNHSMELRTVFYDIVPFPPAEEHMVITTTFEMTYDGQRLKEFPIHHDVDLKFKLKSWNGYGIYDPKTYPYHMDITKNETMIVQAIPTGVGYNINYINSSYNENTSLLKMENTSIYTILYFQQDIEGGHKEVINITANLSAYPEVHREGRMKINDGARFVYHQIAVGPSRYEVFDSHVQAVFAVGNDVQVNKKVAPVYIATFGDDVYQFIQLEDPYEPHEFDQDPYIKSYGFGDMAATTYVGGRINETLYHSRVSPGGRTLMRLEVDNNLGYDLENVTIIPEAPAGFTVTPDNFTTKIPPIFYDFPFINRTEIWDAWKSVYYYWVDINDSVEGGSVYQINFTFESNCTNASYIPADFEIPPALIGVKDTEGHVQAIFGRAVNVTLNDTLPSFVQPTDVRIANDEEKAALELMIATGVSAPGKYNRTKVHESYKLLRNASFQKLTGGKINISLPPYAQMLPWLDNTTDQRTLYVILRTNVSVSSSGTFKVNDGPALSYKNHFNETIAVEGEPETIEAHGPAFSYSMTVSNILADSQSQEYMIGGTNNTVTTQVQCLNTGDDIAESSVIRVEIPPLVDINVTKLPSNAELKGSTIYWTTGDIGPGSNEMLELELYTTPPVIISIPNRGPPEPWKLIEFAQVKFIHGFLKKPVVVPASKPLFGYLFDSDMELTKLYFSHPFATTNITQTIIAEVENNWKFTDNIYNVTVNFSVDGIYIGNDTIPILTPGEMASCSISHDFTKKGIYTIKAKIVEPKLNEFYDTNNELEVKLTVVEPINITAQPDFGTGTDTFIAAGDSSIVFGEKDTLKVGQVSSGGAAGSGRGITRTYIQFDTTGLPTNAYILDANLKLYMHTSVGGNLEINAYQVLSTWDEEKTTWNNIPNSGESEIASTIVDSSAGYKTWDVTTAVRSWVVAPNGNFGLMLKSSQETSLKSKEFYSSDAENDLKPMLTIQFSMLKITPDITKTQLSIDDYEDKELRLEWTPVPYTMYYEIYRATTSSGPYFLLGTTWNVTNTTAEGSLNSFFYDDLEGGIPEPPTIITTDRANQPGTIRVSWVAPGDPEPSAVYYYRIRAMGLESLNSDLSKSPTTPGQLTPTISKYQIFNSTSASGPWTKLLTETEELSYEHKGLGQGTLMYYRIKSISSEEYQSVLSSVVWNVTNSPPSVYNQHITPSLAYTTDYLIANYTFSDPDDDQEEGTQIRWYRDGKLFTSYPIIYPGWTAKNQKWYYTVRPKDGIEFGPLATAGTIIIQNSPPKLLNVQLLPTSPKTTDDLKLYYTFSDADKDTETNTIIKWYKNGVHQPAYDGYTTILSSVTTKNENWNVSIKTSDGTVYCSRIDLPAVKVKNTLPLASDVKITPVNPKTGDALNAVYVYTDADNDKEKGSKIYWYKDDTLQTAFNNLLTIPATATLKDEVWYFTITPHDGEQEGLKVKSPAVKIDNTPPEILNLKLNPAEPRTVDLLWISYNYLDADGDLEQGSEIKWYRNGEHVSEFDNSYQVPFSTTTRAETWKFTYKPKDGFNFGDLYHSNTVIVQNSVPEVLWATIDPKNPALNDDLSVKYDYHDYDNDAIAEYHIKWYKDDLEKKAFEDEITVSFMYTNAGESWYFEIQVSDGIDFSEFRTSESVKINTPPTVTNVKITPNSPSTSSELTIHYNWVDINENDIENGTELNWYCDEELEEDLKNSLIVEPELTTKGEKWYCIITPCDGKDFGTPVKSPKVIIGNTPPEVSELRISPESPTATDELSADYHYFDLNNDPETESILNWFKNDLLMEELIGSYIVPSSKLKAGDSWHFSIEPFDGEDYGKVANSPKVTVVNTAPVIDVATIKPRLPTTTDTLEAYIEYSDIDTENNFKFEYIWYKNNIQQTKLLGKLTVPADETEKGEVWHFTVKVFDGMSWSELVSSEPVTILNTPPEASDLIILPEKPTSSQTLTLQYKYQDIDADPEDGTEIRWFRNDEPVDNLNDRNKVTAEMLEMGDKWYCTIKPKDGLYFGKLVTSAPIKINTAPIITDIQLTPTDPTVNDQIELTYTYFDYDNEPEKDTKILWYRNGINIVSGMKTLPVGYLKPNDRWYVIIQPNDGLEFGEEYGSNELTIQGPEDEGESGSEPNNIYSIASPIFIWMAIIIVIIIGFSFLTFGWFGRRRRKRKKDVDDDWDYTQPPSAPYPPLPFEMELESEPGDTDTMGQLEEPQEDIGEITTKPLQKAFLLKNLKFPLKSLKFEPEVEETGELPEDEFDGFEIVEDEEEDFEIVPDEDLEIEFRCDKCNEVIDPGIEHCPKCGERIVLQPTDESTKPHVVIQRGGFWGIPPNGVDLTSPDEETIEEPFDEDYNVKYFQVPNKPPFSDDESDSNSNFKSD